MNLKVTSKVKGFTLTELLVAVSIIGILSVLGLSSYQVILKNSRDFKRTSDLKTIQSALEQYRADQLYYPVYSSSASCTGPVIGTFNFNCPFTDASGNKRYLERVPADPTPNISYPYVYNPLPASCDNAVTKCINYCLYAVAENSSNATNTSCIDDTNRKIEATKP